MRQLSIQPGSPGSPLPYCHLQPQGCHIQTSLLLPPLSRSLCSLSSLPHSRRQQCSRARYVCLSPVGGGLLVPLTGGRGAEVQIRGRSVKRDLKKPLAPFNWRS